MRDHRGLVVGGYEFDDVQNGRAPGADQLAGPQHLGGQQASWLGRVGAWTGRGVYDVGVEGAVDRVSAIRYDVQRLAYDCFNAALGDLPHPEHADAVALHEVPLLGRIERAARTDNRDVARIDVRQLNHAGHV